jgi:hypothetical protein
MANRPFPPSRRSTNWTLFSATTTDKSSRLSISRMSRGDVRQHPQSRPLERTTPRPDGRLALLIEWRPYVANVNATKSSWMAAFRSITGFRFALTLSSKCLPVR